MTPLPMGLHWACVRIPASLAAGIGAYEQSLSSVNPKRIKNAIRSLVSMIIALFHSLETPLRDRH